MLPECLTRSRSFHYELFSSDPDIIFNSFDIHILLNINAYHFSRFQSVLVALTMMEPPHFRIAGTLTTINIIDHHQPACQLAITLIPETRKLEGVNERKEELLHHSSGSSLLMDSSMGLE